MIRNIRQILIGLGLLTSLITSVHAQSPDTMRVDLPFDFAVGHTMLPAGSYTVDRISWNDANNLVLRDRNGNSIFLTGVVTDRSDGTSRLIFTRQGDQYLLREIRTDAGIHQLLGSNAEPRLAKIQKFKTTSASGSK